MYTRYLALLIGVLLWSSPARGVQGGGPEVSVQILETYSGTYQVTPGVNLVIAVEGNRLTARYAGSEPFPLLPISETKFRIPGPNAEVEFVKNEKGEVTHAVLSQNNNPRQTASRLRERKAVVLPVETLKRYIGKYGRRSGLDLVITLEADGQLMGESTGQFKHPLFAESETSLFFKAIEAQIEFKAGANGTVDQVILHRGAVHETLSRTAGSSRNVAVESANLPAQLTDKEFWKIVTEFSEPNGRYRFENFVSNEDDYQAPLPELKQTFNPNSIYIGVGPEQNFTYISTLKPKLSFVVDIRRQNMLELLLYKALFELSDGRVDFASRLFSRKSPAGLTESSTAKSIFEAFEQSPPDQQLFDANLTAAWDLLTVKHQFELSAADQQGLTKVYSAFFKGGPLMDYQTADRMFGPRVGKAPATWSYKELMSSTTDRNGHNWSYLATEENFKTVQEYQKKNLIIPLVGDFAGPKTLRAIAQYAREHDATIGAFYASNVDEYLFDSEVQDKFFANIATFPLNPLSMMIRVNGGPSGVYDGTFQLAEGKRWAALLCSMPELVTAFKAGELRLRTDVNWITRRSLY